MVIEIDKDIAHSIIYGQNNVPRNAVRSFPATIAYAIKNGIVLPKGHGDLIDRDALRENMNGACMGVMAGSDDYDAPLKTLNSATVVVEADKEK